MAARPVSRVRNWLLTSPPAEWALTQLRELLIGALRQGPMPKHVAFVMDGNRRFAKNHRIETVEGHNLGFEALARILEVCYKAGVTHVTIYAFSIENFKRSKHEVDALMEMAKVKLTQLVQHGDILDRYGARIQILGQRDLIKPDVLKAVDHAVAMTSRNGKCVLNVCFPYTSREEITHAVRETVSEWSQPISNPSESHDRKSPFREERIANTIRTQHLTDHTTKSEAQAQAQHLSPQPLTTTSPTTSPSSSTASLSSHSHSHPSTPSTTTTLHSPPAPPKANPSYPSPELITPHTLTTHLYTANNPSVDLLVRTSGVSRLSDFMLWQVHESTEIVFLDVLWPEFDLWSFLPVLWGWQWRVRKEKEREMQSQEEGKETVAAPPAAAAAAR